jgi:hypothetical protein
MIVAERHENERLRQIIKEMQRHRFGRRAETLPEDQLLLGLEEVVERPGDDTVRFRGHDQRAEVLYRLDDSLVGFDLPPSPGTRSRGVLEHRQHASVCADPHHSRRFH